MDKSGRDGEMDFEERLVEYGGQMVPARLVLGEPEDDHRVIAWIVEQVYGPDEDAS